MIVITMFTHQTTNGEIVWEEGDLTVENISSDDYLKKSDLDYLFEAVENLPTENLKKDEWYQFTFKRVWEDDGSGAKNDLWFDLVEHLIVTQT